MGHEERVGWPGEWARLIESSGCVLTGNMRKRGGMKEEEEEKGEEAGMRGWEEE